MPINNSEIPSADNMVGLTIFATPKSFRGHIGMIQRNAIKSWTQLHPRPEIILFGDEEGIAETAHDLGLIHIPDIQRNEFGTPLVGDFFHQAEERATYPVLMFINSDILLLNNVIPYVSEARSRFPELLMVGNRINLDVTTSVNFEADTWRNDLRENLILNGRMEKPTAIDYFIFTKHLWGEVPLFAVGRVRYDNWLIYKALTDQKPVVNASYVIKVVHQNHDHSHLKGGKQEWRSGAEAERNTQLAGELYGPNVDSNHVVIINHATWDFSPWGLIRSNPPLPLEIYDFPQDDELISVFLEGLKLFVLDEHEKSLALIMKSLKENDNWRVPELYYLCAVCLFKLERFQDAIEQADLSLSVNPGYSLAAELKNLFINQ